MVLAYETLDALTGQKALVKQGDALSCGCCKGCEDLRLSLDAMFASPIETGSFSATVTVSNQQGFSEDVTLSLSMRPDAGQYFAVLDGTGTGGRMKVSLSVQYPTSDVATTQRNFVVGEFDQDYISKYRVLIFVTDTQFVEGGVCRVPVGSTFMNGTMPATTRIDINFIDFVLNYNVVFPKNRGTINNFSSVPLRLVRVRPLIIASPALLAPETVCSYANGNGRDSSPDSDWYRDRILLENFNNLNFSNPVTGYEEYGRTFDAFTEFGTEIAPVAMGRRRGANFRGPNSRFPEHFNIEYTTPTVSFNALCLDHSVLYTNHFMPDSCKAGHTITGLDDFILNFLP